MKFLGAYFLLVEKMKNKVDLVKVLYFNKKNLL